MSNMTNQETEQEKCWCKDVEVISNSHRCGYVEIKKIDLATLRADNEKLIAERAQIDVSYRELIELRKENENLKRYMATPSYEMAIEIQRLKDLVNRAKPWIEAWDIQGEPRIDILQWLADYEKEIGG